MDGGKKGSTSEAYYPNSDWWGKSLQKYKLSQIVSYLSPEEATTYAVAYALRIASLSVAIILFVIASLFLPQWLTLICEIVRFLWQERFSDYYGL